MRFTEFRLSEAFSAKRNEKGLTPFRKTDINDQGVLAAIKKLTTEAGVSEQDLMHSINKNIGSYSELQKYSPFLYDTIAQNAAENVVFEKIMAAKDSFRTTKFQLTTFFKLLKVIQEEVKGLFPLRAPNVHGVMERKSIFKIEPILVPSTKPAYKQFNSLSTAAVTANGDFIFNVQFMEQLLTYADVSGLTPTGKKYQANGGPFPNGYSYIEFLILHEILHYKFGDFTVAKKHLKKYNSRVHNFASDFRSNYILVKAGYQQLPIGLFSDDLNFDREETKNYGRLLKTVHAELQKIPPELQGKVEKYLDDHGDNPKPPDQQNEESDKHPLIGKYVKQPNGTYGKIVDFNPITEKTTVEELSPEEEAALKGKLSTLKKK